MKKILIVDDDPTVQNLVREILKNEQAQITTASDGQEGLTKLQSGSFDLLLCNVWMPNMTGLEMLSKAKELMTLPAVIVMTADDTPEVMLRAAREQAAQFVVKPFKAVEMLETIRQTLDAPVQRPIEVISAKPDWVELLVPCELRSADRVQQIMLKLKGDLPENVREEIGQAFRELLLNAIEWGGKLDANRQVRISYQRAKRMLLYRIADPGTGFNFEGLTHAAITNPPDDPIGHMKIREEKGLRPGGLGLLMTQQLVDELIYNEKHNEVLFVKYLD
jgi:CheY-like chemotaxis protein/anti-sigma regulatory factor (Ser/Thr protein kinase)